MIIIDAAATRSSVRAIEVEEDVIAVDSATGRGTGAAFVTDYSRRVRNWPRHGSDRYLPHLPPRPFFSYTTTVNPFVASSGANGLLRGTISSDHFAERPMAYLRVVFPSYSTQPFRSVP